MTEPRDDSKVTPLDDRRDPALSALYRQAPQAQPPAALDNRILNAARNAARTPVRQMRPRWLAAAGGIAASLFVAVLVVQLLPHSTQDLPTVAAPKKQIEPPVSRQPDRNEQELDSAAPMADAIAPAAPAPERKARVLESLGMAKDEIRSSAPVVERMGKRMERSRQGMPADEPAGSATESAAVASALAPADTDTRLDQPDDARNVFREIARLWQDGDTAAALERYRDFRQRYPEFVPHEEDRVLLEKLDAAALQYTAPAPATDDSIAE